MKIRSLVVDGMLSGTGIRDAVSGGYVDPLLLQISHDLVDRIADWVKEYENAHYYNFSNKEDIRRLDQTGMCLAQELAKQRPDAHVEYYSNAHLQRIEM